VRCWSCGGPGSFEKIERELSYSDRQAIMNQERQLVRQLPCTSCGGSGGQICSSCGDGTVTCNGCGGAREVNCPNCGASGTVRCGHCAATGAIHHAGWIQCAVRRGLRVDVASANAEDQQTFRERISFDQIGTIASGDGGLRLGREERSGSQLTLYYTASVLLECAEATAGAKSIAVRAYGPRREIYNYHGLVGKLLEPDLASLEQSLQRYSLVKGSAGSPLAGVMKRFLASEVNVLIAEGAPKALDPHLAGMLRSRIYPARERGHGQSGHQAIQPAGPANCAVGDRNYGSVLGSENQFLLMDSKRKNRNADGDRRRLMVRCRDEGEVQTQVHGTSIACSRWRGLHSPFRAATVMARSCDFFNTSNVAARNRIFSRIIRWSSHMSRNHRNRDNK
jgi:hypothetical protein